MLISISKVFELFRNDEDSNEGLLRKFEYAWDENSCQGFSFNSYRLSYKRYPFIDRAASNY